jgi:hypothetical protein
VLGPGSRHRLEESAGAATLWLFDVRVASGVYIVRLAAGKEAVAHKRMVLRQVRAGTQRGHPAAGAALMQ